MTLEGMDGWDDRGGTALLGENAPAAPASEKPAWMTEPGAGVVAGVDDDLDEDESYFLESDDDDDDDYDDDYDDDFDDDDDEEDVDIESDDDDDDDL